MIPDPTSDSNVALLALFVATLALLVALAPHLMKLLRHPPPDHGQEVDDLDSLLRGLGMPEAGVHVGDARPRHYEGHRRRRKSRRLVNLAGHQHHRSTTNDRGL